MLNFLPRLSFLRRVVIAFIAVFALSGCGKPTAPPIEGSADKSRRTGEVAKNGKDQKDAEPAGTKGAEIVDISPISRSVRVDAEVEPNKVRPGEHATLHVRLRMLPGWHIKPLDSKAAFTRPTTIELELPAGVEARGEWQFPQPELILVGHGQERGYQGEVLFRRELVIKEQLPAGTIEIVCHVKYQACTGEVCERPSDITLRRAVVVASE